MDEKPRRLRQVTLAGLMAVVAASAPLFAWLRPIDEATAIREAEAFLEQRYPGRYRVIGIAKRLQPGHLWVVSFQNAPGKGPPTLGWVYVDGRGKTELSGMLID